MMNDDEKSRAELLYELRLQRLETIRLNEALKACDSSTVDRNQLDYLQSIARIDQTIRRTTDLKEMMDSLMEVVRSIFQCDQAWLLYPCDPDAVNWKVPFRSVSEDHPIHFGPDDDLPVTPDLAENCRLALQTNGPVPLGPGNLVKDVPPEARDSAARSALLIVLYPKASFPWMMGLHQCDKERTWSADEKRMFQDISGRITDALSTTLFYRDLEYNQERLKHLSAHQFRAQEEERKRLAEEIHDELGQAALAIKVAVENAAYALEDAPAPVIRSLKSASKLSKEIVDKMRRMQRSLYPPTLRDFGVISALKGFLHDFSNIYPMTVRNDIRVDDESVPEDLRVTVFRLAQEALYNAGKHSRASEIRVSLREVDDQLVLEIEDDGIGFDPGNVLQYPDAHLGLGLTSMRERAEMSGGVLDILSRQEAGTTIRCVWG